MDKDMPWMWTCKDIYMSGPREGGTRFWAIIISASDMRWSTNEVPSSFLARGSILVAPPQKILSGRSPPTNIEWDDASERHQATGWHFLQFELMCRPWWQVWKCRFHSRCPQLMRHIVLPFASPWSPPARSDSGNVSGHAWYVLIGLDENRGQLGIAQHTIYLYHETVLHRHV